MKWIRLLMVVMLLKHSSFLFAEGISILPDTLPVNTTVKQLPIVLLRRPASLGRLSGDTLIFDAKRYARPAAFRLEELLKDIPGFRVDGESRIYFNGKEISRIMIDGDDLSGERYRMISRNLRTAMVDKIELIQSHQPNRLLNEYFPGESPAINIRLKEEYKGKISGSAALGFGVKRLRQAEAEAVWLNDKWKELIFLDCNNNGTKVVSDRINESDGSRGTIMYELHPIPFTIQEHQSNIPFGQKFRNDDMAITSMSNFKLKSNVKMNIALTGGKYNLLQEQLISRTILQKNSDPFILIQQVQMKRASNLMFLRTGWDKDHGKNHIVKNIIHMVSDQSDHINTVIRQGTYGYDLNAIDQERQWRLQWNREGTRKTGSGFFLQMQTLLALGELSTVTGSSIFNAIDSTPTISIHQRLYRKGLLVEDDLRLFGLLKKIKWNFGLRSTFENSFTSIDQNKFHYQIFKSFPYVQLSWLPNKKVNIVTQIATGIAIHGDHFQFNQPLHLIEQRIQWKFKRLLQLHMVGGISRKSENIRNLFSGSVLNREGILIQGTERLNFPVIFHLGAGGSQVDLHTGRSWSVMFQYLNKMKEMGQGLMLTNNGEKWNRLIIGNRKSLTVDMQVEQFIMPLKSRIRLNLHASGNANPQSVNENIYHQLTYSTVVDLRFIHQSKGVVGGELQIQHYRSSYQFTDQVGLPYQVEQSVFSPKIWFRCKDKANISVSYVGIYSASSHSNHFIDLQFDANLGKRIKCSIVAQNLLHQKMYTAIVTDTFGITETEQHLNGRRIVLQWRYLF